MKHNEMVPCKTLFIYFLFKPFQVNAVTPIGETPLQEGEFFNEKRNGCKSVCLNFKYFCFLNFCLIFKAIHKGHKKTIEILIEKGASVNVKDKWNLTPLHYIALYDSSTRGYEHWTDDDHLSNVQFFHFCDFL